MSSITPDDIKNFLFDYSNGFLMKYRLGKGIDLDLLDKFYEILEQLKNKWKNEELIAKDIIYELICVVPALYHDLPIYSEREDSEEYQDIIYNLDTAISMCLNPDTSDPHFNTPLKELGDF